MSADGPRVDPTVEAASRLLSVGTLLMIGLVGLGTAVAIAAGRRPVEQPGPGLDPARLIADLLALRAEGILWLGLVLGLALPTARTVVAFAGFTRSGDRRAALVALGVLVVLAASVVVAAVIA